MSPEYPPHEYDGTTPRTEADLAALLRERPPGWEYLLYAGALFHGKEALEQKYRDSLLRYSAPYGSALSYGLAKQTLEQKFSDAAAIVHNIEGVFDTRAQELAFGRPGEPGDPDFIRHIAQRVVDTYEHLLDWSSELRGARAPSDLHTAFRLAAEFTERPIEQIRSFIEDTVMNIDRIPDHFALPEPRPTLEIDLVLVLDIDDHVMDAWTSEMSRVTSLG